MGIELRIPDGDYEGYIFDMDGTLVDTMPVHYQAWLAELREHGIEFPEDKFYSLGGMPAATIIEMLNRQHGAHMDPEETAQRKEERYLKFLHDITPIPEVAAIVKDLHGKKPMAVGTGSKRHVCEKTLREAELYDYFDVIVTSDDYSRGKPFPDPFLLAAEKLGVDPAKCIVFEDSETGIKAAEAAGMAWVLVESRPAGV